MRLNDDLFTNNPIIYIDYDYENVMYRWEHKKRLAYVKFYGQKEIDTPVFDDNRLFNDALRFGIQITKEEYDNG